MRKLKSEETERVAFELSKCNESSAVYKRVLPEKGRNQKELSKIKNELPKATIHYFSQSDFDNLKRIELEIQSKLARIVPRKNFIDLIINFLEIR